MALTKYCFGDLIELCFIRNSEGLYNEDNTIGVNIEKEIRIMKGDASGKKLKTFWVVRPGFFVYNPRGSRKLGLGYNDTQNTYITTFNNMIFKIKDEAKNFILPKYLFMYLSRKEWDRKAEFLSWGSSTEVFSWDTFCDTEIFLPPIPIQQKYVDFYNAMLANQQCYEHGLEDLKLVCDAYIEDLRRRVPAQKIEQYIQRHDVRNGANGTKNVKGISTSKEFREPTSKVNRNELTNYKIVKPRQIGFVQTTHNEKVFAYAFNDTNEDIVVSSVNEVFSTNESDLLPEYLVMFFNRKEFDRYARFHSWGSARETFTWNDLVEVQIPIPDVKIQQYIVDIYIVYQLRKEINEQLKQQIRDICPILIKGSLEEGEKE